MNDKNHMIFKALGVSEEDCTGATPMSAGTKGAILELVEAVEKLKSENAALLEEIKELECQAIYYGLPPLTPNVLKIIKKSAGIT